MVSPLKRQMPGYREIEDRLLRVILTKHGLHWDMPDEVHAADMAVQAAECRVFGIKLANGDNVMPADVRIDMIAWQTIKQKFRGMIDNNLGAK